MKVLVTGGAGFIGSNLVTYLCDQGHQVSVIDNLSFGFKDLIDKRAKFYKGSISDNGLLEKILPHMDVVFHLASIATISLSMTKPYIYFDNNFMEGIALLEAMKKTGVKKIVYSSSASSYGNLQKDFFTEEDSPQPTNPYGASKSCFEPALSAYHHSFGIDAIALRYFNVYGPADDQADTPRAVPIWIKAALKGEPLILYWQGKQRRDYVFVEDIARANLLAAEKGKGFRVYNVGCGNGIWMTDIIEELEKLFGRKLSIKDAGERAGDSPHVVADISRIKKELGWEPKVGLKDGLQRTINYYKDRIHKI
ncbi:NAD-dependent epimerase/dehydratase family protein [Patescibacteria group bacterium]|nr:NAD-dependent epimerase/dehydratase family protein [Patescibacteria group bacterium]